MNVMSINDLKRSGLAKLKQMFKREPDIIIQERGKDTCVLVDLEHYNYLRNCELEVALLKAKREYTDKKYIVGVSEHIKEIEDFLNEDK